MPKCTQVCPHGAGEEDLAAEVPADPDPVPTASAADPMGKRGTGHWPLEHFSLNVAFWACLRSHCIKRCSKHHCLRFQCSSNRILVLAADLLGNRPETTNFFFSLGPGPTPWARAGRTPSPRRQPQTPWANVALAICFWNMFRSMSRFGLVCDHIAPKGVQNTIV